MSAGMHEVPAERLVRTAALAALLVMTVCLLLLAARPVYTDDGWWHLAAGEAFATHGPWLDEDPLLFTGREGGPVPHEWLFDVVLWEVHQLAGFHGVRAVHGLLVLAALLLTWSLARASGGPPVAAALLVALLALVATPRLMQLRPDLVSIPFTLLGVRLLLLDDRPPGWGRVVAWLVLMLVWVNMHSLFLLGINLVIAALAGVGLRMGLRRLRPWPEAAAGQAADGRLARRLAAALGLGVLVTLANPQGVAQHLQMLSSSHSSAMWKITDEWSRFNPFSYADMFKADLPFSVWVATDIVLGLFVLLALLAALRYVRRPSAHAMTALAPVLLGLALGAAVAMLVAVRFVWMVVLPAVWVLHWLVVEGRALPVRLRLAGAAGGALLVLYIAGTYLFFPFIDQLVARFAPAPREWLTLPYRSHKYYAEGAYFMQRTGLAGNVYNTYWTGGFIGYWRAPRVRTFIDGRTEHYDEAVYQDHVAVGALREPAGSDSVLDILDRRGVDIFFGVGFPGSWHPVYLTPYLEEAPGWVLVWRSFRAAIYVRDDERNRENLERVRRWYADEGIEFDPARGLEPDRLVRDHVAWAVREMLLVPQHDEHLARLEAPDPALVLAAGRRLSVNYLLAGAYDSALALDRRLYARFPDQPDVMWRLAWTLVRLGRPDEAEAVAQRYLEANQPDPLSLAMLEMVRNAQALEASLAAETSPARRWQERLRLRLTRFPATHGETWAIDHAIDTEGLPLARARD